MARKRIPYNDSTEALLHPANGPAFFEEWNPDEDNRRHDLLCAEISRLTYANREVVKASLSRIGFTVSGFVGGEGVVGRVEGLGTQAFVARSPRHQLTVLAFRGTEANRFEDLIADAKTLQVAASTTDASHGRVHAGFYEAFQSVRDHVLKLTQNPEGELLVTGHSLGAGLATLAAVELRPAALVTFGSPRVGDVTFAKRFAGMKVRRYVDCCDLVARVPPEQFDQANLKTLLEELTVIPLVAKGLGLAIETAFRGIDAKYTHVGQLHYIRQGGEVTSIDKADEQDQASARKTYQQHKSEAELKQFDASFQNVVGAFGGLPGSADALGGIRRLLGGLFGDLSGERVPIRDLADHAPINYVSAFTGR